ncbi:MAG TPA: PEP-CTERM sorting domain-containing protein [Candidatus Acidoferrales bacterium]
MRILKTSPVLLLLLLCALPASADSVYNISGAFTIVGNNACGGPPCVETLAFSFDLEYESPGPPYRPVVLPGASVTSLGPLASFSLNSGYVDPFFIAFTNTAGDEIDLDASATFLTTTEGPPPPLYGPELYSCNLSKPDPVCLTDFSNEGVPCCDVGGGGRVQYAVTLLPTATVPEASTLAYLLLSLGLLAAFLWRPVRPETAVRFQRAYRMAVGRT